MSAILPFAIAIGSLADWALVAAVAFVGSSALNAYKASQKSKLEHMQKEYERIHDHHTLMRGDRANEIWWGYLRCAFDHPHLTAQSWSEMIESARETGNFTETERFEWLAAMMFLAAEQILDISNDVEWKNLIKDQIRCFHEYVFGPGKEYTANYSSKVKALIEEVRRDIDAAPKSAPSSNNQQQGVRQTDA